MSKPTRPPSSFKAVKLAKLQDRPDECPPRLWPHIHALEVEIARFYPNAWPGQRRLAEALGVSTRTIKRYLAIAVKLGRIDVEADAGVSVKHRGRTNRYRLTYIDMGTEMASVSGDTDGPRNTSSPNGEEPHGKPEPTVLVSEGEKQAGPAARQGGTMAWEKKRAEGDPDGWGPAIGEDPDAPLPGAVVSIDPAVRVSRYFEEQWKRRVLPVNREYVGVAWGDRGSSVGYLRKQLLDHLSYEHVREFIDVFVECVNNDLITLRPGQTAFQCFIGWWQHAWVEDPAIEQERKQEAADIRRAFREQRERGTS